MKINYSVNNKWKYFGHIHTPYVFGARHLIVAFHPGFGHGCAARWKHIAVGIASFIPLINYGISGIDYALNAKPKMIRLDEKDPYKRGKAFGTQLRKETQEMYRSISKIMTKDSEFLDWREMFEGNIPDHIREEMRGLAKGAKVSYDDVLDIHTFVDINAGKFGCSIVATDSNAGAQTRVAVANHSIDDRHPTSNSKKRQQALQGAKLTPSVKSYKRALHAAQQKTTIQSIIFDPQDSSIHLATDWKNSTKRNWRKIKGAIPKQQASSVKLARNLDWPWPICGSETVIVSMNPGDNKHKFVSVTWPGYLGVLSGMNEKGMALASAQSGDSRNVGTPNPILFRTILEETSSIKKVKTFLKDKAVASSMNLVVAAKDGVIGFEFDPDREEVGPAKKIKPS